MFMHEYISHSKRAITISSLYKNCKIKGYQYIFQSVSNDTIFFKKVIYQKKYYLKSWRSEDHTPIIIGLAKVNRHTSQ